MLSIGILFDFLIDFTDPLLGHLSTNQSNSLKAQTLQPSPTVPIEAVTKKCKQEVAITPPSPLNTN
jgi:hypothetical protein